MEYHALPASEFFVNEDDMDVNAPMIHQRIISKLHVELGVLYYHQKRIPYEPLTETMLGEGITRPTPDIILYDNQTEQTRIIIEVCQTRAVRSDLDKVIRLTEGNLYGIIESFVYNYKTNEWLRYRKGQGGIAENSSFSDALQVDLNSFL